MKSHPLFFIFIIITAITSWFSIGFHHADEHFQILEWGAYKAGWLSPQDLPWEFASAVRSSVQPFIVFLLIRILSVFNIENPFVVSLLLRMITAALCIICFVLWRNRLKLSAESSVFLTWYDAALLLWFIPYLSVRFSSEIWGGCLFFISLALIYQKNGSWPGKFLMAGCLACLAFFFRFQTGFLIAGSLLFRIFDSKRNFFNLFWYGSGFVMIMAMNVCLDYWFYQKWCFTPWNYFEENIINARAASFGTEPFYYYLFQILERALPLQGLAIIAVLSIYMVKKFRDEISISVLLFLTGHFITAHKEMRFMFPLIFILPFVFASSMQWITPLKFTRTIFFRLLVWVTIITNFIPLIVVTLIPADPQVALQRAIYHSVANEPALVFYEKEDPFSRVELEMNFYKNKKMKLLPMDSLSRYAENDLKEKILIVTSINASSPLKDKTRFRCIYQNIPQWILKLNFRDWVSRTHIFRVYEMKN